MSPGRGEVWACTVGPARLEVEVAAGSWAEAVQRALGDEGLGAAPAEALRLRGASADGPPSTRRKVTRLRLDELAGSGPAASGAARPSGLAASASAAPGPGASPREVWGRTPAWDAGLRVEGGRVEATFRFVTDFVAGLGPSEAASRRWLVRAAVRMALGVGLAAAGGLLVHGAGLLGPAGAAWAFLGPSGAGKTTMASRLPAWTSLGDDVVALWPAEGRWWVSGTPLRGREGRPTRVGAWPLEALVTLRPRATALAFRPRSAPEGLAELLARVCLDADPAVPEAVRGGILATAAALAEAVPSFSLASDLGHDVSGLLAAGVAPFPGPGPSTPLALIPEGEQDV
jgi:hypothetical protein